MSRHEDPTSADLEFHLAVARACRNSVLIRFLMELRQPIWHWMKQKAKYDWGYAQVYDQHEAILRAIEQRDAKTAEEAVKSHLRSAGERLITSIHEGEAEPPAPSSSR
jgi:GntR family transcriptional repressor for pyruvate dehydrogenase complex